MKLDNYNLNFYIKNFKSSKFLSKEEEILLAKNFKFRKDINSAKRLVESNLNYVIKIASNYSGYGFFIKDLVQVGVIGLMKAVKNFDPDKKIRLISFAIYWVKSEIHEYIIKNLKIVKIIKTKNQKKLFFNLNKIKKISRLTLREKNVISNLLNIKKKDIDYLENNLQKNDISLIYAEFNYNKILNAENNFFYFKNDPLSILEKNNWINYINKSFYFIYNKLDNRSKKILFYRWISSKKYTLKQLGVMYNVSSERIRQLEKNALNKLKTQLLDTKFC